jgi:hypothetical protein
MPLMDGALLRLPENLRHPNLVEQTVRPSKIQQQYYAGVLDGSFNPTISVVANDWEVSTVLLQIRTTSTAGARAIVCTITPTAGSQYLAVPLTVGISTADKSTRIVAFGGPGLALGRYAGSTTGYSFEGISFPLPDPLYMTTGYQVSVFDANGVDAADTVGMTIIYREITEFR